MPGSAYVYQSMKPQTLQYISASVSLTITVLPFSQIDQSAVIRFLDLECSPGLLFFYFNLVSKLIFIFSTKN